MSIERIPITSRADWLALRRKVVGASEVAAVCGVCPYKSPLAVYDRKVNPQADEPMSDAQSAGLDAEPMVAAMLRRRHPEWEIIPGEAYYRDLDLRIGATPDLFVSDGQGGFGLIQVKTTNRWAFRKEWEAGGAPSIPLHYRLQAMVEAHLAEAHWAMVACLVWRDTAPELHELPLDLGSSAWKRAWRGIVGDVASFWARVENRDPPPVTPERDADVVRRLYPADNGEAVDLSQHNRAVELAHEIAGLDDALRLHAEGLKPLTDQRDAAKTELMHIIGPAARARIGEFEVTCKTIKRAAIAATTYRRFTLTRAEVNT